MRIVAFITLQIISLASSAANKLNTIILTVMDYPPYHSPSLEQNGPIPKIVSESLKNVGYGLELRFVPWNRAIEEAKLGKNVDGIMGIWYSEERTQFFFYSEAVMSNKHSLIKKKNSDIDLSSSEYRLGTVRGYYIPESVKRLGFNIDFVDDDQKNLQKLFSERIDLTLLDPNYLNFLIKTRYKKFKNQFTVIEPPVAMMEQYIAISKKTPNAQNKINLFNKGLKEVKQSGLFNQIIQEYDVDK